MILYKMDYDQKEFNYYRNNTNLSPDVIRLRLKMYKDFEKDTTKHTDILMFIFVYTLLILLVI